MFASAFLKAANAYPIQKAKRMTSFEKLKCNAGELFFVEGSSVAHCVKLREFHDPGVEFMMRRHAECLDPFFDVGANVGLFSILASKIIGKNATIVAFEPDRANNEAFAKNLAIGASSDIRLEKVAVSDNEEPLQLGRIDCGLAAKSSDNVETVICRRIDSFVAETRINPSFLKIDVEGFEWPVINGARGTIRGMNTLVEMEFSLRDLPDFPEQSKSVFTPDDWVLECHLRDFDRELLLASDTLCSLATRAKHVATNQVFWPVVCHDIKQREALFEFLKVSTRHDPSRKWELLFCPIHSYQRIEPGLKDGFEVRETL